MEPSEIRKELHKYLDEADGESLSYVREVIATYEASKTIDVGEFLKKLPVPSRTLTKEELTDQIARAEEALKKADYYTQDEVVAIMKSWHA